MTSGRCLPTYVEPMPTLASRPRSAKAAKIWMPPFFMDTVGAMNSAGNTGGMTSTSIEGSTVTKKVTAIGAILHKMTMYPLMLRIGMPKEMIIAVCMSRCLTRIGCGRTDIATTARPGVRGEDSSAWPMRSLLISSYADDRNRTCGARIGACHGNKKGAAHAKGPPGLICHVALSGAMRGTHLIAVATVAPLRPPPSVGLGMK